MSIFCNTVLFYILISTRFNFYLLSPIYHQLPTTIIFYCSIHIHIQYTTVLKFEPLPHHPIHLIFREINKEEERREERRRKCFFKKKLTNDKLSTTIIATYFQSMYYKILRINTDLYRSWKVIHF